MKTYLRMLPPIHELQHDQRSQEIMEAYDVTLDRLTKFLKVAVDEIRQEILTGTYEEGKEEASLHLTVDIFERAEKQLKKSSEFYLKQIINATGTILHTNLGRARLSDKAVRHVVNVAKNYSNLEYSIEKGKRGSRHDIIEQLLKEVTGAEAAMVVNNNAAAVFLILRALARHREVIVSRGQLVEIGGSFRVSSIMEESDARLVEVGTTNKTHLYDYENAINEETALILKVHTSNFKTIGFTESVDTKDLVDLKNNHEGLLLYEDLGSGALFNFNKYGIGDEPHVSEVIASGVDVVSFSGDKLLGGPQAGIIAGKKEIINKLKKHQLARVLRVDKMTFAALEATLIDYLTEENELFNIPTVRDILQSDDEIKARAEQFIKKLTDDIKQDHIEFKLTEETSQIGGGTMPDVLLPTTAVSIFTPNLSAQEFAERLRECRPSIVPRIQAEKIIIDFRTVTEEELPSLIQGFQEVITNYIS